MHETFRFRPVDPERDGALLHAWVTRPGARFWGMQEVELADVVREHRAIAASAHHAAFLGLQCDVPAFLCERYDPAHHEVAGHFDVRPGDVGMHFLVGAAEHPVPGFTTAVIRAVMTFLFDDPATRRVVVEPDVRNHKVHRLNALVGFEVARTVALSDKEAALSFCTRERFTETVETR